MRLLLSPRQAATGKALGKDFRQGKSPW